MKSTAPNCTEDEIEVLPTTLQNGLWGRIRIRERQGPSLSSSAKCSIFLTADQLEEHARECLALAAKIRNPEKP